MAGFLAGLGPLLTQLLGSAGGTVANAGANAAATGAAGLYNAMGLPSAAAAIAPAVTATAPATGLAGLLSNAPGMLKSAGSGILNNAGSINSLMGAMNQGRQLMAPPPMQPSPMAPAAPHPQQATRLFENMGGQAHQVPQAGGLGMGQDPMGLVQMIMQMMQQRGGMR